MRSSLLFLLALVGVGCNSDGTPNSRIVAALLEPGSALVVEDFRHARLLAPGETATLRVRLLGGRGQPLAGLGIEFLAPDDGPGGTFGGARDAAAITDANGEAEAVFTAGAVAGVCLVDALVTGTSHTVSFAVTIGAPAAPAVTARDVRRLFTEDVLGGLGGRALLHGPFLVAAGAQVATNMGDADDETVFSAAEPSWIAWLDVEPSADYEHPTRFLALRADRASPQAGDVLVADASRWFELLQPGTIAWQPLLPPTALNTIPPSAEGAPARLAGNTRDECAIVIYGPKEANKLHSTRFVASFFRNVRRSRHVQHREDGPTSLALLEEMIETAREQNCPKLFLYMIGHGYASGAPSIMLGRDDDRNASRRVTHEEIAETLERILGGTGTDVCIVVETCFAARSIVEYQNRGFDGEIVTSSDESRTGWNSRRGFHYFAAALVDCWEDPPATPGLDGDGDGVVSLTEAYDWVQDRSTVTPEQAEAWIDAEKGEGEHGITSTNRCEVFRTSSRPQTHPLSAEPKDWNTDDDDPQLPDIVLALGQAGVIRIRRPADEIGLDRQDLPLTVTVEHFGIAQIPGTLPGESRDGTIAIGATTIDIPVLGVGPGTTTYTVTGRGRRDVYRGTATIRVLAPTVVLAYDHGPFTAGEEIELSRLGAGYRVTSGEPGCDNGAPHVHGTITIDGLGPFEDENPTGCGHGVVRNAPGSEPQ